MPTAGTKVCDQCQQPRTAQCADCHKLACSECDVCSKCGAVICLACFGSSEGLHNCYRGTTA